MYHYRLVAVNTKGKRLGHDHAFNTSATKKKPGFEPTKMAAATIARFIEEEGLITRPLLGDRIALCPPLIIDEAEIDEMFDRFEKGLAKGLEWAKKEGAKLG